MTKDTLNTEVCRMDNESPLKDVEYAVGHYVEDTRERLRISKDDYLWALASTVNLTEALLIQERFDIVIGNFEEFESEILSLALQHSIYAETAPMDFARQRRTLTRRILNLLAACRFYRDQLDHGFSQLFGKKSVIADEIATRRSQHYDSSFSYRLMEELRNAFQHSIVPVRSISASHKRTSWDKDGQIACTVTPQIDREVLQQDRTINRKIGSELAGLPKMIDVKPHIKEYISLLADINMNVRERLEPHVQRWEAAVLDLVERYESTHTTEAESESRPIEICSLQPNPIPSILERRYLPTRVIEMRRALERRTDRLLHIAKHYVTNQSESRIPEPGPIRPAATGSDV